jgi:hypothetical protein
MWIQPSEVADLTTKTRGLNPENNKFNQQNKPTKIHQTWFIFGLN